VNSPAEHPEGDVGNPGSTGTDSHDQDLMLHPGPSAT
jgi:hypothetical protein